jgi:hypothetical protein
MGTAALNAYRGMSCEVAEALAPSWERLVRRGHMPPPDPTGPGIFNMAGEDRTIALLAAAGFGEVRAEEVPVRFAVPGVVEYVAFVADTAGPIAMALRGLDAGARDAVTADAEAAPARFAGSGGYDVPGVALCAVAR